jgi:hypothetical protein
VEEIPERERGDLSFHYVEEIGDALKLSLERAKARA